QTGVLARVDRVRRVVVHLGAVRGEQHEGGGCGGSHGQCPRQHRRQTEGVEGAIHRETSCPVRARTAPFCLSAHAGGGGDGGLGPAVECRYGPGSVARTAGGAIVLCLLVASVGRGDDGGDWRDRVTLIASERLRGEAVDWFRPQPG